MLQIFSPPSQKPYAIIPINYLNIMYDAHSIVLLKVNNSCCYHLSKKHHRVFVFL